MWPLGQLYKDYFGKILQAEDKDEYTWGDRRKVNNTRTLNTERFKKTLQNHQHLRNTYLSTVTEHQ